MQLEKTLKYHPAFVHLFTEVEIAQGYWLSLTDEHGKELRIFLGQNPSSKEYEIRVYKRNPADSYIPRKITLKRYEANNEFVSYFFDDFIYARHVLSNIENIFPTKMNFQA